MKIVSFVLLMVVALGLSLPIVYAGLIDLDFDYSPKTYAPSYGYGTYPYYNSYLSYGGYGGYYSDVPFGYYEVPFDKNDALSPFLADKVFEYMYAQPLIPYHFQQQTALFSFLAYQ